MKIAVCIKQVRHIYARTGKDPGTHFIAEEDGVNMVNPYDELSVEEAIRVKERLGEGEVILITLGNLIAEKALRRCLAMGADRLIQIYDPSFGQLDPWGVSTVLSRAIDRLKPDLILCGKESIDERNGQVGAYLAELLGVPFISCVNRLEFSPGEKEVRVRRDLGKGNKEILECKLPALFSVVRGINEPRYPAVPDLLRALDHTIERWDGKFFGLSSRDLQPEAEREEIFYPRPRSKRIPVPESTLDGYERILSLLSGVRVEKKGNLLEGPAEAMASEIVRFLKGNGILEP